VGITADWDKLCEDAAKLAVQVLEGESVSTLPVKGNAETRKLINTATALELDIKLSKEFTKDVNQTFS